MSPLRSHRAGAVLPATTLAVTLSLTAALSACGAGAPGAPTAATAGAVSVGIDGTHFTGVPATVPPGTVTLRFTNGGTAIHMAAVARLSAGHTASDIPTYLSSPQGRQGPPPWLTLVGGVDELAPGHTGSWTGHLAAGPYAVLSFTPDAEGRPEVADGLLAPFAATGRPATGSRPRTQATVTLGPGGALTMTALPAGTTALLFTNRDSSPRTVDVTAVRPGRTYDDVLGEAQQGTGVPPSLVRLGGTVVPPGSSVIVGIEPATAGTTYVAFDIDHVQQGAIAHEIAR